MQSDWFTFIHHKTNRIRNIYGYSIVIVKELTRYQNFDAPLSHVHPAGVWVVIVNFSETIQTYLCVTNQWRGAIMSHFPMICEVLAKERVKKEGKTMSCKQLVLLCYWFYKIPFTNCKPFKCKEFSMSIIFKLSNISWSCVWKLTVLAYRKLYN